MISEENKEKIKEILEKLKFLKVLIPITGIIITNLQLWEIIKITNNVTIRFIIFDVILNLIIMCLSAIIYNKEKNIEKANENAEILNQRIDSLTELNDSIRCFKHDFYNIVQAIDGYITMNNMGGLKKYFSKLIDECDRNNKLELLIAKSIKDPAIYGVLLDKYRKAENQNITMNIDALTDFNIENDKSYLVSRVIGILLDNAIEAAADCDEKCVNVSFTQHDNNTVKKILIENTYKNKDVDTVAIFEKEFSSKKEKGNKGLGLWKVRNMIRKESNVFLLTNKSAEMFKQELKITI